MQVLIESVGLEQAGQIATFYKFVCGTLGIEDSPDIQFVPGMNATSFGSYSPIAAEVRVATDGRHISDILRTFAHELVHHKQMTVGDLDNLGLNELEYEANAVAGMLMRDYNKLHPEMFGFPETLKVDPQPDVVLNDTQGPTAGDPTRPSTPVELAELSNKTLAGYKRKAKAHLRFHKRDHEYSRHGYYGIQFLHNPNLGPKREQGIKTAEEKLKKRYTPVQEEMTAGSGDVAGIGIGPQGEPGFTRQKKSRTPILKRKTLKQFMRGK